MWNERMLVSVKRCEEKLLFGATRENSVRIASLLSVNRISASQIRSSSASHSTVTIDSWSN